jgi:UPF0716 family protein affecting phage T7 exclusion
MGAKQVTLASGARFIVGGILTIFPVFVKTILLFFSPSRRFFKNFFAILGTLNVGKRRTQKFGVLARRRRRAEISGV